MQAAGKANFLVLVSHFFSLAQKTDDRLLHLYPSYSKLFFMPSVQITWHSQYAVTFLKYKHVHCRWYMRKFQHQISSNLCSFCSNLCFLRLISQINLGGFSQEQQMHSLAKNTCYNSIPVLTLELLKNYGKLYKSTLHSPIFRNNDNSSIMKLNK